MKKGYTETREILENPLYAAALAKHPRGTPPYPMGMLREERRLEQI